jgi:hypothetical protein
MGVASTRALPGGVPAYPLLKENVMNPFGKATMIQVRDYFGMNSTQLRQEWTVLSAAEKEFYLVGVGAVLQIPA